MCPPPPPTLMPQGIICLYPYFTRRCAERDGGTLRPACPRSEGHFTQCVNENSLAWAGELLILDVGECTLGRAGDTETDKTDERGDRGRQKLTGREKRSRGEATETEHVSHSRFLSVLRGRLRHVAPPPSPSIKTSSFIDR